MSTEALGRSGLSLVDKLGAFLSVRPIARVVERYDNPRVLDIGCGFRAHVLLALQDRIRGGVGIDESVSPEAKANPKFEFMEGHAEQALAKLPNESFEVVMMVSVLEHLWEPLTALQECKRLLRPGGTLILNVPNWWGKAALELSAFRLGLSTADSIDDHKTYYDKRDLWPLLVKAGFRPRNVRMKYHKLQLNLFATAVKE